MAADINEHDPSATIDHWDAERLFTAHAGFVASFLHRLGSHKNDIDDLVQDVFLTAHRKGGFTAGTAKPRTWLAAIAVHLLQNRRRGLKRRREDEQFEVLENSASTSQNPEESLELVESLRRVQRALDTLDVDHRAAFLLFELESESCLTIAEYFDVPVGTIYSRLHKARKMFLKAYQESDHQAAVGLSALASVWGLV